MWIGSGFFALVCFVGAFRVPGLPSGRRGMDWWFIGAHPNTHSGRSAKKHRNPIASRWLRTIAANHPQAISSSNSPHLGGGASGRNTPVEPPWVLSR